MTKGRSPRGVNSPAVLGGEVCPPPVPKSITVDPGCAGFCGELTV
jgi:hypothetical protein